MKKKEEMMARKDERMVMMREEGTIRIKKRMVMIREGTGGVDKE